MNAHPSPDNELRRSLRLVVLGMAFGSCFTAVTTGSPLTGFAKSLGAGDFLYGLLLALPVAGGAFQLAAACWIERMRRRKVLFLFSHICQRLLWVPIACVPFILPAAWPGLRVWTVIALLAVSSVSGSIGHMSFLSWMGDLVPADMRGRFFSLRYAVGTVSTFLAGAAAGFYLDLDNSFVGFAAVFIAGAVFGILDILCFIRVKEPPMTAGERIPVRRLLGYPFHDAHFRRYMWFWAAWLFAVNIAAPFFNVYMLGHLRLGYLQIALFVQMVTSLGTVLMARVWGRLADACGHKPVMAVCCAAAAGLPLLWFPTAPGAPYLLPLIAAVNFAGGVCWSGIDVTYLNLLLGCSPGRNRPLYMAGFTIITALIGNALAFLCGGFILDATRAWFTGLNLRFCGVPVTNHHLLFAVSSLLRVLVILCFLPGVREDGACRPGRVVRELLGRGLIRSSQVMYRESISRADRLKESRPPGRISY